MRLEMKRTLPAQPGTALWIYLGQAKAKAGLSREGLRRKIGERQDACESIAQAPCQPYDCARSIIRSARLYVVVERTHHFCAATAPNT